MSTICFVYHFSGIFTGLSIKKQLSPSHQHLCATKNHTQKSLAQILTQATTGHSLLYIGTNAVAFKARI